MTLTNVLYVIIVEYFWVKQWNNLIHHIMLSLPKFDRSGKFLNREYDATVLDIGVEHKCLGVIKGNL